MPTYILQCFFLYENLHYILEIYFASFKFKFIYFISFLSEDLLSHEKSPQKSKQFNVGDSVVMCRKIETLVGLQSNNGGFIKDMIDVSLLSIKRYWLYLGSLECIGNKTKKYSLQCYFDKNLFLLSWKPSITRMKFIVLEKKLMRFEWFINIT